MEMLEMQLTGGGANPMNPQQVRYPDELPAWVEITFVFTDPKKVEKERTYRQIVLLPQSQETYVPPEALSQNIGIREGRGRDRSDGRRRRHRQ
jgi:hypothetical protein